MSMLELLGAIGIFFLLILVAILVSAARARGRRRPPRGD